MSDRAENSQQSVAKGFMILTIAMMSTKVLSVLYSPIMNLILGKEAYGIYTSSYTIFTYIYTIANSGVQAAIAKIVSELDAKENFRDAEKSFRAARFLFIGVGIVLSLFLLLFASPLGNMFESKDSILAITCLAPGILFTSLMCAYKGYFQGIGNMTAISVALVGEQVLNIVFSLVFAALFIKYGGAYGAAGGTVGTLVGALVAALYLMWVYKRSSNSRRSNVNNPEVKRLSNERIIKTILKYSIPITVGSAIQQSGTLVDLKIVKNRLFNLGLSSNIVDSQYGFLNQYNTLISVPMAIIGALATAILPAISRVHTLSDKKHLRMTIRSTYRVTFMISIPCAVGLSVLASPIARVLGYNEMVGELLIWGGWALVLFALTLIQTSILQGMGKMTLVTVYSAIGILVKILVNYILVGNPEFGLIGAVWGNAACYLVMVILFQIKINGSLGKIRLFPCGFVPLISGVAMGVITFLGFKGVSAILGIFLKGYMLNLVSTIITIGISALFYGVALILLGGVKKTDLRVLPSKAVKIIPRRLSNYIR